MNPFRTTYRELDYAEGQRIREIKEYACTLHDLMEGSGRELALARTKLEEAVMWAVKGVTA